MVSAMYVFRLLEVIVNTKVGLDEATSLHQRVAVVTFGEVVLV